MGRFKNAWSALVGPSIELRRRRRMPSLTGANTAAGVVVTPELALQIAAVYSAVRVIAEAIAGLPIAVIRKDGRRRLAPAPKHAGLVRLLTVRPNTTMDAGEFWRLVVAWMLIRGNAYVYVQRNGAGEVVALWPVPPTMVKPMRTPLGMFAYRLSHDQKEVWLPVEPGHIATHLELLHYRWFGLGAEGLSPIAVARQQIGISHAATSYVGGFFERDATPETVVTTTGNLSDSQYNRLIEQLEDRHEGFENSHRLAVFEGGAKLDRVSLSPADAAFLDIYKLTRTDIAAIYGVPPHKIGDLEHATFSNIEHQSIEFVQDGLLPPIRRLELVTAQLFDDDSMQLKFDPKGRMRGDTATQTQAYAVGRQWGWYSANDILEMEDQPPIEGGDEYLAPLNMVPAGSAPVVRAGLDPVLVPRLEPTSYRTHRRSGITPAEDAPSWVTSVDGVLTDYVAELRSEVLDSLSVARSVRALVSVDRDTWDQLLAEELQPTFAGIVTDFGTRSASAAGGQFVSEQTTNWVAAAAARQARNFNETIFDSIDEWFDELDEEESPAAAAAGFFDGVLGRTLLVAAAVVNAAGGFGSQEGARQAGGREKTWLVNSGNPRPSHAAMHGETVPIDQPFSNGCMWPGDPSGGVDEVAGCTCGVEFGF